MRVRDVCYTKNHLSDCNKIVQVILQKGKVIYGEAIKFARTHKMNVQISYRLHHLLTPKDRRKIIYNQYKADIRDILKQLCGCKGEEILERHLMPDHIHMLVSIPPRISVSSFIDYLKGKSALMMFDRYANLKYKSGSRYFWPVGY